MYVCIIPGKKSATWQLVTVVLGPKTMQNGQKRRKIAKSNHKTKGKIRLNGKENIFWMLSFFFRLS